DMDVPPTLVSFAVAVADGNRIVSPEFKHAGDRLVLLPAARDENDMPDYENIKKMYDALEKDIAGGRVAAAFVLQRHGVAEAVSKMAFGNRIGAKLEGLSAEEVFAPGWGSILIEVKHGKTAVSEAFGRPIGRTCSEPVFVFGDVNIALASVEKAWNAPLEKIFRTDSGIEKAPVGEDTICESGQVYICREKIAKPTVFIPTFPGTNCEYDSARAFEEAGANVIVKLLRNRNADDIRESVEEFEKAIAQSQIIMFPGGFSGGDEPEGSAKFFATAFRNEKLKEAVLNLLEERDGLALGICNGFQALIKLGLLPHGDIRPQTEDSPTLTYNTIGRHISKMVYTKIVSDKSPWLSGVKPGEVFVTPVSHGEGRFVAPQEWIDKLFAEGLVATRYVTPEGEPTMDEYWNPNGSYAAIEGILSPNGRVFGKMAHIERKGHLVASNIIGEQDMKVFESGVKYFK
ncbi:MAG: phosphoribosylformylglycinamidine synthase subunit PurQ, partial [Lachnospiraceae bacterium]|nr:phosphoribosylformylglycinamidine synthase subunit PurQ [Lachnospiraceae bacterium]